MAAVIRAWASRVAGASGHEDPGLRVQMAGATVARAELNARALWPEAPARVGRLDRPAAHALLVAHELAARAARWPPEEIGVVVGTALGCAEVNSRYHRGLIARGAEGASPMHFAQTIPSTPAGEASIAFGWRGHSATLMAGRCAGVAALAEAARALAAKRARAVVVLAGDSFGEDEVALRAARGLAAPGEASVALLLTEEGEDGVGIARLEVARVWRGAGADAGSEGEVDWLSASGLIELVAWLEGRGERFACEVRCASGRRGVIRARRGGGT